jgi:hypothetical protein
MSNLHTRRERRINWITALISIIIAVIGWMRFQQALRHWYYLIELGLWPPPIYQAVSGGLIGTAHSLGLLFHITRRSFTPAYLRLINALIFIWLWIDRIFIGLRDYFALLLAGTVFLSLCLVMIDLLIYRHIRYPQKETSHVTED